MYYTYTIYVFPTSAHPLTNYLQGSITGAYSPMHDGKVTPSFILLAVQEYKLVCYVYELQENGEVEVSKTEFTKATPVNGQNNTSNTGGANPALLQSLLA